jgi:prevent-host-death family protein
MRTAAVAKLKASLSEYLGHVKEGEEVIVTDRGKPIAKIVPYTCEGDQDQYRLDLIRRGLLRPGKGPLSHEFLTGRKHRDIEADLLRALQEDREAGL